jgi:1,5-anhydro-D-fructose reductase (1,5-anhydro-D-mannitol-forming)
MPLGWAIISTGRHPDLKMAPAINAAEDSFIAAAVSRDLGRASAFAKKHEVSTPYDDVDVMLLDPSVDVVYIASPNALHAEQTIKAAAAGKHVLVEKPMALNVVDCQQMIDACNRAGVKLGLGFHLRTHPGHVRLRELIQSGGLGAVTLAEANWGRGVRGQLTPPAREGLQAWWDDPVMIGAGAFMATGVHCIDTLRFLTGREITDVTALTDATSKHPLEELVALSLRFDDGSLGRVLTGRRTPDYVQNDVVVYGTLGRGGVHGSIDVNMTGQLAVRTDAFTIDEAYEPDPVKLYTRQVAAFNKSVIEGGDPAATGMDGLRAAQVTGAMLESAKTGDRINLE